MRGVAIRFPPQQAFWYWNHDEDVMTHIQKVGSHLGRIITLSRRATCRMCGKVMKRGEQARIAGHQGDFMPRYLRGYIHRDKCIPTIEVILCTRSITGGFEESASIRNDNVYFEEGFYSHSLEEAIEDVTHLLNGHFYGIYPLAYIEIDGIRQEPVYSDDYLKEIGHASTKTECVEYRE